MAITTYIPMLVACISGVFSLLVAFWVAIRNAKTTTEIELLKARLALQTEERKGELAHYAAQNLANRKGQLERVNLQLKQLYGPLYALSHASHRAWTTFRSVHGPKDAAFWGGPDKPTEADANAWRLWITTVFMPLNLEMERLVLSNMDLLFGEQMENCLIELCAHVEAYKTVLERWKANDFSTYATPINFPGVALRKYVEERFVALRREQQRLLSDIQSMSRNPQPEA